MSIVVTRGRGATAEQPASCQLGERSPKPSGIELVSEVSDLVTGAGLLIFVLAPFALPGLALAAVAVSLLLIPLLIGAILIAPVLLLRRWWHSRDHTLAADTRRAHEASGASINATGELNPPDPARLAPSHRFADRAARAGTSPSLAVPAGDFGFVASPRAGRAGSQHASPSR